MSAEVAAAPTEVEVDDLRRIARRMRRPAGASVQPAAKSLRVAVILPCHNEALSIARVVREFRAALPGARIIVYDNASTDATGGMAEAAGAEVFGEPRPGKGNVVRRMFADVDADIYVMADGDGTYDAASAPLLVEAIAHDNIDMAIGARAGGLAGRPSPRPRLRQPPVQPALFRAVRRAISRYFQRLSRLLPPLRQELPRGVNRLRDRDRAQRPCEPAQAADLRKSLLPYGAREEGSASKLRSLRDGWRILATFALLLKETRPALFFGALAALTMALSAMLAAPIVATYFDTGLVPRLPTAVLCTGLALLAALFGVCGLILDSLARSRLEQKRILYLSIPAPRC